MFVFVLQLAADKKLLDGKTVAVDSTMLEANAAMKSIVRKDTGEDWKEYLRRLAAEAGIENPTDEDLRRFDKTAQGQEGLQRRLAVAHRSGQPDRQDERRHDASGLQGRTRRRSEDRPGVGGGRLRSPSWRRRNAGRECGAGADSTSSRPTVPANIREAVADKGYHSADTLALLNGPLGTAPSNCRSTYACTLRPEPVGKLAKSWLNSEVKSRPPLVDVLLDASTFAKLVGWLEVTLVPDELLVIDE